MNRIEVANVKIFFLPQAFHFVCHEGLPTYKVLITTLLITSPPMPPLYHYIVYTAACRLHNFPFKIKTLDIENAFAMAFHIIFVLLAFIIFILVRASCA